jgi:Flp pilus assembly protein TadD
MTWDAPAQTSGAIEAITAAVRARNFAEAAERSRVELLKAPNDAQLWTLNGACRAAGRERRGDSGNAEPTREPTRDGDVHRGHVSTSSVWDGR